MHVQQALRFSRLHTFIQSGHMLTFLPLTVHSSIHSRVLIQVDMQISLSAIAGRLSVVAVIKIWYSCLVPLDYGSSLARGMAV